MRRAYEMMTGIVLQRDVFCLLGIIIVNRWCNIRARF